MTTPSNYHQFIEARRFEDIKSGFSIDIEDTHHSLKPHQKYLVRWACRKGRAAVFADTGLGKSRLMCEWGKQVAAHTGGRVLFLSPLAVALQTVDEASRVDLDLKYMRTESDIVADAAALGLDLKRTAIDTGHQFIITNYEMLHNFDLSLFDGVVLDESSILKNFDGRLRKRITDQCENVPYKLSCTATPSPNDYMELGTQAEFLGVMPRSEMLAMFFQHDSNQTSKWVLKGHGRQKFWEWMATWAVFIKSPEDLGLDGSEYVLPPLDIKYHIIPTDEPIANTLTERRDAKRASMVERVAGAAELANGTDEPVVVWCHLNDESTALAQAIPDAVEVKGADKPDHKEKALIDFSRGNKRGIVTKSSIAGFGLNWQHCNTVIFAGLDDSFESFYQAIRRCYRFGQKRPVTVHCFLSSAEQNVIENLQRKEQQHEELSASLREYMNVHMQKEVVGTLRDYDAHDTYLDVIIPDLIRSNVHEM